MHQHVPSLLVFQPNRGWGPPYVFFHLSKETHQQKQPLDVGWIENICSTPPKKYCTVYKVVIDLKKKLPMFLQKSQDFLSPGKKSPPSNICRGAIHQNSRHSRARRLNPWIILPGFRRRTHPKKKLSQWVGGILIVLPEVWMDSGDIEHIHVCI